MFGEKSLRRLVPAGVCAFPGPCASMSALNHSNGKTPNPFATHLEKALQRDYLLGTLRIWHRRYTQEGEDEALVLTLRACVHMRIVHAKSQKPRSILNLKFGDLICRLDCMQVQSLPLTRADLVGYAEHKWAIAACLPHKLSDHVAQ